MGGETSARELTIDRVTQLHRLALPVIDRILQPIGGYAQCVQDPAEYVAVVDEGLEAITQLLRDRGFNRSLVASLKIHQNGHKHAGSWVWREHLFAAEQLHVTLFDHPDGVELYAHWEDSWLRHPLSHYRGGGWEPEQGAETLRTWLEEHDVSFTVDRSTIDH